MLSNDFVCFKNNFFEARTLMAFFAVYLCYPPLLNCKGWGIMARGIHNKRGELMERQVICNIRGSSIRWGREGVFLSTAKKTWCMIFVITSSHEEITLPFKI